MHVLMTCAWDCEACNPSMAAQSLAAVSAIDT
jgi:hypothetical protein